MNAALLKDLGGNRTSSSKDDDGGNSKNGGNMALMAALKSRQQQQQESKVPSTTKKNNKKNNNAALMAALQSRKSPGVTAKLNKIQTNEDTSKNATKNKQPSYPKKTSTFTEKPFEFHQSNDTDNYDEDDTSGGGFFVFVSDNETTTDDFVPRIVKKSNDETTTVIQIPLAPLIYRACDYTFEKAIRNQTVITVNECIQKLGIFRAVQRERTAFHDLINSNGRMEEEELGKTRFMELLSNYGGVARKLTEILLKEMARIADHDGSNNNMCLRVDIDGLDEFLHTIENNAFREQLERARLVIENTQTVSFYPGLGELFCPGSKLISYPEGMEGSPLGCSCVQSWYSSEENKATGKAKRKFVLVIEFLVSVGDELVFVAMTDVYPEFHDTTRNVPLKDLSHRKLIMSRKEDQILLKRLQQRGKFYASVATKNHFLEYYADSFYPILKGRWSNAVRPLTKGGRVMVDVKRGILEGHIAVRFSSSSSGVSGDATSDTVKEAIKLYDSSKRTGIAVPFRTCVLPQSYYNTQRQQKHPLNHNIGTTSSVFNDLERLWMSWPMLVGFSFTARVWGKLLLGMPKLPSVLDDHTKMLTTSSPRRPSSLKMGVEIAALGGEGSCGNCGYIRFQTQAFDQLVLAKDKKELIRAVARNSGRGGHDMVHDSDDSDDEDDNFEDGGIDVVANKGGASIFLLHGPPGCGKTLTAEAIAELLEKPLYIVTAGDLGISASEVEANLGSVLELCQTWDALVLIDEADVFLEARTSTEIERNALVCVMLRLLEYYTGCLFLSSNRSAESIDSAIASRITVMLGYPPLNCSGRGQVWKNLIELVPPIPVDLNTGKKLEQIMSKPRKVSRYRVDFSDEDYQKLAADFELNGRQIKNSIVLARALAKERGTPLNMSILNRAVIAVAGEGVASRNVDDGKSKHHKKKWKFFFC